MRTTRDSISNTFSAIGQIIANATTKPEETPEAIGRRIITGIAQFYQLQGVTNASDAAMTTFTAFRPFLARQAPEELVVITEMLSTKYNNPLNTSYGSLSPFAYGRDRAAKFKIEPVACGKESPRYSTSTDSPNFAAENLSHDLAKGSYCFAFYVQLLPENAANPLEFTEDATKRVGLFLLRKLQLCE